MMRPPRRALVAGLFGMVVVALAGSVLRWLAMARALAARRWDVAPPFPAVGASTGAAPLATGAWWTNLAIGGGAPAVQTPYAVRHRGGALEVSYGASHRVASAASVVDAFVADLVIGAGGAASGAIVASDALTAAFRFDGATALLQRGSPYIFPVSTLASRFTPKTSDSERYFAQTLRSRVEMSAGQRISPNNANLSEIGSCKDTF